MFVAYVLLAIGAFFVSGFLLISLVGSLWYLARGAAGALAPARHREPERPLGRDIAAAD